MRALDKDFGTTVEEIIGADGVVNHTFGSMSNLAGEARGFRRIKVLLSATIEDLQQRVDAAKQEQQPTDQNEIPTS